VFTDETPDGVLKVIDFGDAKKIKDHEVYTDFACTLHYMPPEILRPRSGFELKKGDLWTTGVMAYLMVCGRPPFTGKDRRDIVLNITSEHRKLRWPKNVKLSPSFKDFIGGLLTGNVEQRMSANDALNHEWITGKEPAKPSLFRMFSENSKSLMASLTFNLVDLEQTLDLDDFDIAQILDEANQEEDDQEDSPFEIKLQAVEEQDDDGMGGLVMVNEITGDTNEDVSSPADDLMVPTYTSRSNYSNSAMSQSGQTTSGLSDGDDSSMQPID